MTTNNYQEIKTKIKSELDDFYVFLEFIQFPKQTKIVEFIANSGTLNRIFRRWYQMTWLKQSWTNEFSGTTPRQFISKISADADDLQNFDLYVTNFMVLNNGNWKFERIFFPYCLKPPNEKISPPPSFIEFPKIKERLTQGVGTSKKDKLINYYENYGWWDFIYGDRDFFHWLYSILKRAGFLHFCKTNEKATLGKSFLNEKGKAYFNLDPDDQIPLIINNFFSLSAEKIINSLLHKNQYEISQKILSYIKNYILKDDDCWISFDDFYISIWNTLRKYFNYLMDFELLTNIKNKDKEPINFVISIDFAERLGIAIDEHLMHPLERFLGMIELVWTDTSNFFYGLQKYISLAKELAEKGNIYYADEKQKFYELQRSLFSPCKVFRLTNTGKEIVKRYLEIYQDNPD